MNPSPYKAQATAIQNQEAAILKGLSCSVRRPRGGPIKAAILICS